MSLFHRIATEKFNTSGNRMGFWGAVLALGLLFLLVEFSYTQFSLTRQLLGQNSPEGATAGWWWSLSVMWLISALRPRTGEKVGFRTRRLRLSDRRWRLRRRVHDGRSGHGPCP